MIYIWHSKFNQPEWQKKSKGKVIQLLSPENYIRQKARTLPVYECWVNAGWDESQIATVIVARKHSNGNITSGTYLVDLACLGLKDTFWHFNIPESEYRKKIDYLMKMDGGVQQINYVLAHNIVYAGIEFAGEFEFMPHKNFISVTQFILEEDDEDIPEMEIECGIDGLPYYMQGPLDSEAKTRKVVAQLERVAGHGNFYLMNEDGVILNDVDNGDEDSDDDDCNDDDDPFSNMSQEDIKNEFEMYFKRLTQLSGEEKERFFELGQSLADDMLDYDKFDEYFENFQGELADIEINEDTIPDEMLGIEQGAPRLPAEVKELFFEMIDYAEDSGKIRKMLPRFRKNPGVEAAAEYIDLLTARYNISDALKELLPAASKKYPHYGLIQMLLAEEQVISFNPANPESYENIPCHYNDFFPGRDSIHPWEFFNYINLRTLYIVREKSLEKIEAWKDIIYEFQPEGISFEMLDNVISLFECTLVASRLHIK